MLESKIKQIEAVLRLLTIWLFLTLTKYLLPSLFYGKVQKHVAFFHICSLRILFITIFVVNNFGTRIQKGIRIIKIVVIWKISNGQSSTNWNQSNNVSYKRKTFVCCLKQKYIQKFTNCRDIDNSVFPSYFWRKFRVYMAYSTKLLKFAKANW